MSPSPSRLVRLCGTDQPDAPSRRLTAGRLSVDLQDGALRYIRFGAIEVLRGIAFLVRDEHWGTLTPEIGDLAIDQEPDSFRVHYRGVCQDGRRRLTIQAVITGRSDGALAFDIVADAETDVLTNRTGFVVLHPLEGVAGRPVRVRHADGRESEARFPDRISPAQPILDIRALSHEIAPGLWATCRMEGDAFEMEDQRNWSDASFKTYIRPLAKPRPYTLTRGSRTVQSVSLEIAGERQAAAARADGAITVTVGSETEGRVPAIGLGVPAAEAAPALAAVDLIRRLGPRLLVCQADLRQEPAPPLDAYGRLCAATGAELVLEIVIPGRGDPAAELAPFAAAVAAARLRPGVVAVSPASDLVSHQPGQEDPDVPPAEAIYRAARAAFPAARLAGGVFAYFTELNRKRPPVAALDIITHTTCPIVHAADDRSVMESLEALPAIAASVRAFAGGRAYRVGPSAIGCRQNPYGAGPVDNPAGARICLAGVDPRQRGLFAAAWNLAYVAAFARAGAEAVTLGAPTGPFGVIHRPTDDPQPWFDETPDARLYPAFHVLAGLAPLADRPLLDVAPSRPEAVAALACRRDGRPVLWLANLTAEPITVALAGLGDGPLRAAVLDAAGFERAARDPDAIAEAADLTEGRIALDAYAVARVRAA